MKRDLMIVIETTETCLTLDELCEICQIPEEFVYDLVADKIIFPAKDRRGASVFDMVQLQRIKTVIRLQQDLEINLAGVAVVMDLLDEMERLKAKAALLDRLL